jgi:hypothetical protein
LFASKEVSSARWALFGSEELGLAPSAMESLPAIIAWRLAKVVRQLREPRTAGPRRRNVADENRAEQGVPLEEMDEFGLRNRLASSQASGSANDNPNSPSTTSGGSGTLTPGSDENLERQGKLTLYKL